MLKKFVLFIIIPVIYLFAETVVELNQKGIKALEKKDYSKAEEYFKKSLAISPDDAYANYNLACTYALLSAKCEYPENPQADVFELLKKAVDRKASYKTTMLQDPDLKSIKNSVRFYEIAGLTKKQILTKIIWYGPKPGVANIDKISFFENGSFTYFSFMMAGEAPPQYIEYKGSYIWIEENIQIQFKDKNPSFANKKRKLNIKFESNTITIEGLDHELSDFEDRCGA